MPETKRPSLSPRKVYLKDASFESPGSPNVFMRDNLKPDIEMNINVLSKQLDDGAQFYEVILQVTATATQDEQSMFLVEVQQAGLFEINAENDEQKEILIHIGCANMLLPFAREEVSSLVTKGGFPQLLMTPINFESIYRQRKENEKNQLDEAADESENAPEVH